MIKKIAVLMTVALMTAGISNAQNQVKLANHDVVFKVTLNAELLKKVKASKQLSSKVIDAESDNVIYVKTSADASSSVKKEFVALLQNAEYKLERMTAEEYKASKIK